MEYYQSDRQISFHSGYYDMTKKFKPRFLLFFFIIVSVSVISSSCSLEDSYDHSNGGSAYYFNAESGNDENSGDSPSDSWRTLSVLESVDLKAGDKIYLASGQTFANPLIIKNAEGSSNQPITFSTYAPGEGDDDGMAFIKTEGEPNAVYIENSSFIYLENLTISAGPGTRNLVTSDSDATMRCGILVEVTQEGSYEDIHLNNLVVEDLFFEEPGFIRGEDEVNTANGTQKYGWGVRFINNQSGATLQNITVNDLIVRNVAHTGIKFTAHKQGDRYGIRDVRVSNSQVLRAGGPGIQMSGVKNALIDGNTVDHSGSTDDSRKWGRGSGLWTWSSSDILIEKNKFMNANGPGDSAGAHIDFNSRNIVMQYNFSANNAGGFCEILGNTYNCSYRYNISVNDGHRVKGKDGAFQEGKVLWLSGYAGQNSSRKGPFNSYVYNNTIFVDDTIQANVAIDRLADGIYIANNIFHIEGDTKAVKGDQYNPENEGGVADSNPIFKNNLFLHGRSWPESYRWQDSDPIIGDVQFANPGALDPEAYIPKNIELVKNRGIEIKALPDDSVGLFTGLKVTEDILGRPIVGQPDMGAIEVD